MKQNETGQHVRSEYQINGRHVALSDGRKQLIFEINGDCEKFTFGQASHHEAVYLAAAKALRKAHDSGHTDVVVCSPNSLLAKDFQGEWKVTAPNLVALKLEIEALVARFDSVEFR